MCLWSVQGEGKWNVSVDVNQPTEALQWFSQDRLSALFITASILPHFQVKEFTYKETVRGDEIESINVND